MSPSPPEPFEVRVSAPSRLHFGMLAPAPGQPRRFGGLGAMIQQPGLRLTARRGDRFTVSGPLADRAAEVARRVATAIGFHADPPCTIEIEAAPPEHVGLGTGTQLGLAVAAAVAQIFRPAELDLEQLARWSGRAARSAIGTHGFARGGLLFEQGKLESEAVSPISTRIELPPQWRFVLFWPDAALGLSGEPEQAAFRTLRPVPAAVSTELQRLATEDILPAAAAADSQALGEALFQFGRMAGVCFSDHQHGAFASPAVADLVSHVRSLGIAGAGQSSWGPTVYALAADEDQAQWLVHQVERAGKRGTLPPIVTCPNNRGADVQMASCQTSTSALAQRT